MIDKSGRGFSRRAPKLLHGLETVLPRDLPPLVVYIHMKLCTDGRYVAQNWISPPRAKALVADLDLSFHMFRRRAPKRMRVRSPVKI